MKDITNFWKVIIVITLAASCVILSGCVEEPYSFGIQAAGDNVANNTWIGTKNVLAKFRACDAVSPLLFCQIKYNAKVVNISNVACVDTTQALTLDEGSNPITLTCKDPQGNLGNAPMFLIRVDTQKPTVTWISFLEQ
jgi:PBP1b-binding outer membrane lipoprotein LpoB